MPEQVERNTFVYIYHDQPLLWLLKRWFQVEDSIKGGYDVRANQDRLRSLNTVLSRRYEVNEEINNG